MNFVAAIGCGLCLLSLLFTCAFYFQRLHWKRNKRLGKHYPGFCPSFSSLGSAFQNLQKLAQPQVEIVMQEEDVAEDAEDEEEIAKDGIQQLHRQLKQIKNGDAIDKLTILLHLWRS